jgi:predicted ATPase/class 3 adenylate cyclase
MRFCGHCAAPLVAACPSCGASNPPGHKFCGQCAAPLQAAAAPEFPARPASYTPRHLAEKILISKAALEGERKQVTVLFADLKGSMELLADRDPEEARRLLDPVLEHMMEAVHRYEGTVNQVMGDGIMALFGAPLAHEDHAVRACYAALRMQESVKNYAEKVRRSHAAEVNIRVGLNSGEVVVRAIGSDLRMDYTAVGQTTHLAARMEQLADPGAIVITPDTLALAEGYVEVKSLGPVRVKGLVDPVEVYAVVGAGPARTRLQASARRGLARFVGRNAELEHLHHAEELAGAGHGQVAAIVGEAGVGKSRLIYEFTHSHRMQGWLVLEGASISYGKTTSYLPVIDLLKVYFKIQERDDPREIRAKVTGRLLTLDRALEPTLPALLALLDVPVDDATWQTLDPPQRRQRTLDAVKRLLLRESQVQPLLVVFEDLHWIDGQTQALLDSLVDSLGSARLLLLVNYRPEYRHDWASKTAYSQMRIDALVAESAGQLLEALLGDDPSLALLKQLLVEQTEANPLFLEESVRALVETGALAGEHGAYRLTRPVEHLRIPATVQAILAARIDRLAPEGKRLLQSAAVIGKDVPMPLLLALVDAQEPEVRAELAHLQAAEFLYETRLFPDLEYTFKHALTHEVAYGSLLQDRRRALHALVIEAIERLYADRLDEQVERLSHHAMHGQDWEKAVLYARQAAKRAAERSANREAATFFEQALAALTRLTVSRATREQAIDIRLELRNVLLPLNDFASMTAHLREAEALALALNDRWRLAWVSTHLTAFYFNTNQHPEAKAAGRLVLEIATELDDFSLQVLAHFMLGLTYLYVCDYRPSIDLLSWNVDALQGARAYERFNEPALPAVTSRSYLLRALAEVGEFDRGAARADEARKLAVSADHPFTLASALEGIGFLHLRRGAIQEAIAVLESGLRLCEDWQLHLIHYSTAAYLGSAYALAGRHTKALPLLEQAASVPMGFHPALWMSMLGEAHLLAGRLTEASACAEQALTRAEGTRETGSRAWALRLQADIAARAAQPDPGGAEASYGEALALAGELGMRPLVAHCHLGLASLYRRTGQREEVRKHLTTATTMYRQMDMRFYLEQAEAEVRELTRG